MSLLTPLGLLALIGIAILILIYLLKPNYQQKVISSTFVWKLSLKYKKKKLPINKFRNILILICQLLIITACAFILAQPFIREEGRPEINEQIAIIDASSSMQASYDHRETRFDRAIGKVETLAEETLNAGGLITVIYAGEVPYFVCQRATLDDLEKVKGDLSELSCSFGSALIDEEVDGSAMRLAETVLEVNPDAAVSLYTDTTYLNPGNIVNVVDVTDYEWNAAILDGAAEFEDPYYKVTASVAVYGRDTTISVSCRVNGYNGTSQNMVASADVFCTNDETFVIDFTELLGGVYAYDSIDFSLNMGESDSYEYDDAFTLYGGSKAELRIQYASSKPNPFFQSTLDNLDTSYLSRFYDVYIKEINASEEAALEGFDFYIFEHTMPEKVPTDGIVLLVDPDAAPTNLPGMNVQGVQKAPDSWQGTEKDYGYTLALPQAETEISPLVAYLDAPSCHVNKYTKLSMDSSYQPLLYCADTNAPIYFVKDDDQAKVAVLGIDVHYSDFSISNGALTIILANLFTYFMPATITDFVYEIGDMVSMNTRGEMITFMDPDGKIIGEYNKAAEGVVFPISYRVMAPGMYTIETRIIYPSREENVTEYFYVKTLTAESNIVEQKEALNGPIVEKEEHTLDIDLLLYFAAALVTLLFLEWTLQLKEHF